MVKKLAIVGAFIGSIFFVIRKRRGKGHRGSMGSDGNAPTPTGQEAEIPAGV